MLDRRQFIASSAAVVGTAMIPGAAQAAYKVPAKHMPVMVQIDERIAPGEIHVDPNRFYLYWTMPEHQAIRYAIRVGRPGLYESGDFTIQRKRVWPRWRPTDAMIEREPDKYEKYADGMAGGYKNPLGARAMNLHDARNRDTHLRIHGTPEPWTIGTAVSNGCAGMINEHIAHLFDLVPIGTRVVLYPQLTA
jgi:lipoprotein-anchoring transpeptidase ErfK/SrfK